MFDLHQRRQGLQIPGVQGLSHALGRQPEGNPSSQLSLLRQISICGLEGMPAGGKSTLCGMFPRQMVSNFAGADVEVAKLPSLLPLKDSTSEDRMEHLWGNFKFFTIKEEERTDAICQSREEFVVLDRTWLSQIAFLHAITKAFDLSTVLVADAINMVETKVSAGQLYFPSRLLLLNVSPERSNQEVLRRDGRIYSDEMLMVMSAEQLRTFTFSRANAYESIKKTKGMPIRVVPGDLPLAKKRAAVFAGSHQEVNQRLFFLTLRENVLAGDGII